LISDEQDRPKMSATRTLCRGRTRPIDPAFEEVSVLKAFRPWQRNKSVAGVVFIFKHSLRQSLLRRNPMTIFTVHWSKDGGSAETHRINLVVAVAKARQLEASGYQVRIADRRGRQFVPCEFDELLH
jgi:hypothetical protein